MTDSDPTLVILFAEALERTDPAERAAYLDEACAGNAALRRQVEALLAADAGAGRFLGTLRLGDGKPFAAPNLWGLIFGDGPSPTGNPPSAGSPSALFFTAGTFRGAHGVIGEINVTN